MSHQVVRWRTVGVHDSSTSSYTSSLGGGCEQSSLLHDHSPIWSGSGLGSSHKAFERTWALFLRWGELLVRRGLVVDMTNSYPFECPQDSSKAEVEDGLVIFPQVVCRVSPRYLRGQDGGWFGCFPPSGTQGPRVLFSLGKRARYIPSFNKIHLTKLCCESYNRSTFLYVFFPLFLRIKYNKVVRDF